MHDVPPYDNRFDDVTIDDITSGECTKDRLEDVLALNIPREEYVTIEDLEAEFQVSRYQISRFLDQVGAKPFGELKNYRDDGRRTRGVGKIVYRTSVIEQIKQITSQKIDIVALRAQAMAILQQKDDDK